MEERDLLTTTANFLEDDFRPEQKKQLDAHIHSRAQLLEQASLAAVRVLSAELNGILSYYDGTLPTQSRETPDLHFLVSTNTYQGKMVTHILSDWLREHKCCAEPLPIRDLNTNRLEPFRAAMSEMVSWCETTLIDYRKKGWEIIFNLTAGFKSVQGFLQTLGMFYADEIVYIFQSGPESMRSSEPELIHIPRLPLALDPEGVVRKHLETFRRLENGGELDSQAVQGIPETLLMQIEQRVGLSAWGELVWKRCKAELYAEGLLSPLSEKLCFSKKFSSEANKLNPERLQLVNKQLDQLARFLETNDSRENPKSLSFKKLTGNPEPGSTHEIYGWSDRDAARLFGHYEGEQFIIDLIKPHPK
jgi:CRISPR/Cas system-associated protein Csm6